MQGDRRGPALPPIIVKRQPKKEMPERLGGYARLLLPLWGNGRIEMLLGAVVLDKAARKQRGLGILQDEIVVPVQRDSRSCVDASDQLL